MPSESKNKKEKNLKRKQLELEESQKNARLVKKYQVEEPEKEENDRDSNGVSKRKKRKQSVKPLEKLKLIIKCENSEIDEDVKAKGDAEVPANHPSKDELPSDLNSEGWNRRKKS